MNYRYLDNFIDQLQTQGRYAFTFNEFAEGFPKQKTALHMALSRLMEKERIVRVRNGFYVIVPPEYAAMGMLPVPFFIHDLMLFLQKPYYIALVSASALHGAAHQQPQTWTVIIPKPLIRPIQVKLIRISFVLKSEMPRTGVYEKKTDTGYVKISGPVLTAMDLIQFERQSGGFSRVIEMIEELTESMTSEDLLQALKNRCPVSVIQRMGFICEYILKRPDLTNILQDHIESKKLHFVALSPSGPGRSGPIDKRWQIIQNIVWDSDI